MAKDFPLIYPNDAVNVKSSTQLFSRASIEHENASSEIDKEIVPIEKIRYLCKVTFDNVSNTYKHHSKPESCISFDII